MFKLDHEKTRGAVFCPLLKELCTGGWTKSMGQDEKTGERPKCSAWFSLPMIEIKDQKEIKEVHACAIFEWPPQLGYEHNWLLHQGRASTDKVATEVEKHRRLFISMLPDGWRKEDALKELT